MVIEARTVEAATFTASANS